MRVLCACWLLKLSLNWKYYNVYIRSSWTWRSCNIGPSMISAATVQLCVYARGLCVVYCSVLHSISLGLAFGLGELSARQAEPSSCRHMGRHMAHSPPNPSICNTSTINYTVFTWTCRMLSHDTSMLRESSSPLLSFNRDETLDVIALIDSDESVTAFGRLSPPVLPPKQPLLYRLCITSEPAGLWWIFCGLVGIKIRRDEKRTVMHTQTCKHNFSPQSISQQGVRSVRASNTQHTSCWLEYNCN